MQYIRYHQKELRADLYQGLADAIENSDSQIDGTQIGKRIILPSSFTGSARYQHQLYQDAMGILHHYVKPDFFITFTCNPQWKEITNELFVHQTAADHPDIVARVFRLKLHALLQDLYCESVSVLGKMIGLIYVIEWQKRGPSHAHILGICDPKCKPRTLEDFDSIVCAEIPDEEQLRELHKIVATFMMHGPCGTSNPHSPYMEDSKCTKRFPKDFVEKTFASDGYPHYRRRNNGKCVVKNGIPLDNGYVFPYNPYLSNLHISKSCKYLYKYVYKGPDMVSVAIQPQNKDLQHEKGKGVDEINKYVNYRFTTASEGY